MSDDNKIKAIIMAGGGLRGISYLGVLKALEDYNLLKDIKCFGGSSIGAVAAALMCTGCRSSDAYHEVVKKLDFSKIQKLSFLESYMQWGIDSGNGVEKWLEKILRKETRIKNCTFEKLYKKTGITLVITATCLETQSVELFSHRDFPNLSISKALRMSVSLPFIFSPVKFNGKTYVDGGLLSNFPIKYFPPLQTLGIRMLRSTKDKNTEIESIGQYIFSIWDCVYGEMTRLKIKEIEQKQYILIEIDTPNVGTFDFDLDLKKRKQLFLNGYRSFRKYVKNNISK